MTGWEKRLEHSGAFPTSTWEAQQERDPRGVGGRGAAGGRRPVGRVGSRTDEHVPKCSRVTRSRRSGPRGVTLASCAILED